MWMRRSVSFLLCLGFTAITCSRSQPVPKVAAEERRPAPPPPAPQPAIVPIVGAPTSFVSLVKRARASVVNIHTKSVIRQRPMAVFPFGEDSPFYQLVQPPEQKAQSLGTGFIISAEGDI